MVRLSRLLLRLQTQQVGGTTIIGYTMERVMYTTVATHGGQVAKLTETTIMHILIMVPTTVPPPLLEPTRMSRAVPNTHSQSLL